MGSRTLRIESKYTKIKYYAKIRIKIPSKRLNKKMLFNKNPLGKKTFYLCPASFFFKKR